jgi:hypothetical protein
MLTRKSFGLFAAVALVLWASDTVVFAQPANFPQTLSINTTATFVSQEVPSSANDFFNVTFLGTNPTAGGGFTFRDCTISGTPAGGAVNVGNCRWTEFVDGGFNLLLFTFNWQGTLDVGTSAVFGQFCLLNEFEVGNWVRFFTSDGTSASVVGSASGSLTYQSLGSDVPSVSGTYSINLAFLTEDCNFLDVPPDLPTTLSGMLIVEQNGTSLTALSGSIILTGSIEENGDFVLVSTPDVNTVQGCTFGLVAGYAGNFLSGTIVLVLLADRISGVCSGISLPCSVSYAGTITPIAASTALDAQNTIEKKTTLEEVISTMKELLDTVFTPPFEVR